MDSFYVDIAVSQLLVCVPPFVYLKISGTKTGELIPYKKIRISDALLAVVMTYLFYPLMLVMNLLTMFFVDNTSAELATTMGQENLFLNILFVALLPAFVEEFVFRGVFYQTYRKSSMKAALVLSGLLFGCMHMNFNLCLWHDLSLYDGSNRKHCDFHDLSFFTESERSIALRTQWKYQECERE